MSDFYNALVKLLETLDFDGYADESSRLKKGGKEYRVDLHIEEYIEEIERSRFNNAREMFDYIANNVEDWFPADNLALLILGYMDKHGDVASISLKDMKKTEVFLSDEERRCLLSANGRQKLIELVRKNKSATLKEK